MLMMRCFNPRAREGRDIPKIEVERHEAVSIHAPVKGATRLPIARTARLRFNPRAREGRDKRIAFDAAERQFQSTRP